MSALIRERYEALATAGRGGQGIVLRALDVVHQRQVAIKVIDLQPQRDRQAVLEEARILFSLRPHLNLPLLREDFTDADRYYLVMDWIEGRTLAQVLADEGTPGLSLDRLLDYLSQAADALDHLHDHDPPVVHQDVKPANLILTFDGRVVLVDFGISRHQSRAGPEPRGTPDYVAPEIASEPPTPASDIYSLAVTAYTLLTGAPPRPEIRPKLNGYSGQGGLRALRRGMAIDPSRRPPSAAALIEALQAGTRQPSTANPSRNGQHHPAPPSTNGHKRRIRGRTLRQRGMAITAAVVVLIVVWVVASRVVTEQGVPGDAGTAPPQLINGPAWVTEPQPVPMTLFGVTMNSTSGMMPSFRVGSVRFWDSRTRWANLQPARGQFAWFTLDRLVAGANQAGLSALFVLGGTPGWAAPNGPKGVYADDSRTAPPDDLTDWDTFIRAVVQRYHGRVEAYELWDMGNDSRFYSGSQETLVEMTRRASQIIRTVDPQAIVVCPSMGQLWESQAQQKMQRFAELGGYQYCDVAGIKLYPRSVSDSPESMLELVSTIDKTLHRSGVHPPLWNTGTTYNATLEKPLAGEQASTYAVRFFLTGLYAHDLNVQRMYFYSWGSSARVPVVLQAEGGAPTQAALDVEQLQSWLDHAFIRSCGHGLAIQLPANVWQCTFTIAPPNDPPHTAVIRWTDHGTAATAAGPRAVAVRYLDGTIQDINATATVTVSERPVFIAYQRI